VSRRSGVFNPAGARYLQFCKAATEPITHQRTFSSWPRAWRVISGFYFLCFLLFCQDWLSSRRLKGQSPFHAYPAGQCFVPPRGGAEEGTIPVEDKLAVSQMAGSRGGHHLLPQEHDGFDFARISKKRGRLSHQKSKVPANGASTIHQQWRRRFFSSAGSSWLRKGRDSRLLFDRMDLG